MKKAIQNIAGYMLGGLTLSVWTIAYMKLRGKGNPMDAFGHEVAPRTQHQIGRASCRERV